MKTIKILSALFIFFFCSTFLACPVIAEIPGKDISRHHLSEKEFFAVAENLFKKSQYDQAVIQYKNYTKKFPGGYFLDDAIFQMGESYRLRKNYFMAIRYYQLLDKLNIKTYLYNESEYKVALCYLYTGHYKNALLKLVSNHSRPHDKKREWDIIFSMGMALEGMQDNRSAFKKYLLSAQIAPDVKLKNRSEFQVLEMINNDLSLDDLIYLSGNLSVEYPLGLVLFRLAEIYGEQREYELYKKYITRFLDKFPAHELYGKGKDKLDNLLAKGETIKTKIGCILPLSGEAAASGQKILQGIQLAFNMLPDDERENIELIVKDSKGDVQTVDAIIKDLGADDDVVCIIGPMFSKTAKIAIEKAEISRLPMISPSASVKGLPDTSQYFFRNSLTQELQGRAIAEYAINNLDLNRFVVFYSSDLYGVRLKNVFLDQIYALGGEIIDGKSYDPTQNDFKEQILSIGGLNDRKLKKKALRSISEERNNFLTSGKKIIEYSNMGEDKDEVMSTVLVEIIKNKRKKDKVPSESREDEYAEALEENEIIVEEELMEIQNEDNPDQVQGGEPIDIFEEEIFFKPFLKVHYDAIFIPGYPDQIGLIVPQLAFYNINKVQLLGGNGWNSNNIVKLGGKYVNGAIFVDGFFSGSYLRPVKKFTDLYEDFFDETPNALSAQAFDAANMVFNIASKKQVGRQVMKEELLKIKNYRGASGRTTILPNGDSEKSLFFISVKNNKRVQIN